MKRPRTQFSPDRFLVAVAFICASLCPQAQGQAYIFTVDAPASTADADFSLSVPFVTDPIGTSFLIGSHDTTTNTTGTITLPGLFGGGSTNTAIPITAGGFAAESDPAAPPSSPTGGFRMNFTRAGGSCSMSGLALDLLGGAPSSIDLAVSLSYANFHTLQPSGLFPSFLPIEIPLGSIDVSELALTQTAEPAFGSMTFVSENLYSFSIMPGVVVSADTSIFGSPVDLNPAPVPILIEGSVTFAGEAATVEFSSTVMANPTVPGTTQLPAIPFMEPIFGANLILNLTLGGLSAELASMLEIIASGTPSNRVARGSWTRYE